MRYGTMSNLVPLGIQSEMEKVLNKLGDSRKVQDFGSLDVRPWRPADSADILGALG